MPFYYAQSMVGGCKPWKIKKKFGIVGSVGGLRGRSGIVVGLVEVVYP